MVPGFTCYPALPTHFALRAKKRQRITNCITSLQFGDSLVEITPRRNERRGESSAATAGQHTLPEPTRRDATRRGRDGGELARPSFYTGLSRPLQHYAPPH